jgi:hypothetical protein
LCSQESGCGGGSATSAVAAPPGGGSDLPGGGTCGLGLQLVWSSSWMAASQATKVRVRAQSAASERQIMEGGASRVVGVAGGRITKLG